MNAFVRDYVRYLDSMLRGRRVFLDLAGHNVGLVLGSRRSGTTWIQELLNWQGDFRVIFEPFRSEAVPECPQRLNRGYVGSPTRDAQLASALRRIVEGRFRNAWTDQFTSSRIYRRRLIKTIRLHLALGWFHAQCPHVAILLVLRHPIAVALSAQTLGFPALDFFADRELVDEYLAPFAAVRDRCHTPFERQVLHWCVENYMALRQLPVTKGSVVFYEEVAMQPASSWPLISETIGCTSDIPPPAKLRDPSSVCGPWSDISTGERAVSRWRAEVTERELDQAVSILADFGLDSIYGRGVMPCRVGLDDFRKQAVFVAGSGMDQQARRERHPETEFGKEGRKS
jgi:hypothetical protein